MNPEVWGPHMWFFLHTISFNYPDAPTQQDKDDMKSFIYAFQKIIPCDKCKNHFKQHLTKFPVENYLSSKKEFAEWVVMIHNIVNKTNGKREYSFDEVVKMYVHYYSKSKYRNYVQYVAYALIVGFILYFAYGKISNKLKKPVLRNGFIKH